MKVLISAFSFALAQEDVASSELENSKIFQAIEMDAGRYSNYRNSLDRKYARSQAGFGTTRLFWTFWSHQLGLSAFSLLITEVQLYVVVPNPA